MWCSYHTSKFSCSKCNIYIMTCILSMEEFHLSFTLLSYTWHYRDRHHIFRIYTDLFSKIRLHHRTKHLLWWLRCRKWLCHPWELWLCKSHPTRTTGSKHRSVTNQTVCVSVYKLIRLFHNSKVGRKWSVKYIVGTHFLERIYDLSDCGILIL